MIGLGILACAEIRYEPQAPAAARESQAASASLGTPPAPESDFPVIMTAAASTSATIQTVLVIQSRRQLSPPLSAFIVSPHLPAVTYSTGKPRFLPLLI